MIPVSGPGRTAERLSEVRFFRFYWLRSLSARQDSIERARAMGPHRLIHNRKGYLTETVFDERSGRFVERPWPPAIRSTGSMPKDEGGAQFPCPVQSENPTC